MRMLAGVACAALTILAVPATGATNPQLPTQSFNNSSAAQAVSAFYASRRGAPLWLRAGADSSAAREFVGVLQRASLDGLSSGPALAAQAQAMMAHAQSGDPAALAAADRFLSSAFVTYVQALQTPPAGMSYADNWVAPRRDTPGQILARAAAASSLPAYVRKVSDVNPLYAQLRDAAWTRMQSDGSVDPRVLTSLERVRDMPTQDRYVMVDTAGARLYMIENGRIAGSMKVIVGKADPSTQTPMLASTIYYATLNPYWHVTPELIRSLIAKNVLDQGFGYLKSRGYQVMSPSGDMIDPASVDWHAVAAGSETVQVRQLPGPANSMGRMKFGFANSADIYLHDTPSKDLFAQDDRNLSHGCVRLEDAEALGRWLLGRDPQVATNDPEQNVQLPTPVPIYVTYLTAQANGGQLSFTDDVYGRDAMRGISVAGLR
ncbi:MAG TPA: L,D-transpeptidase family protein [Sphingomicrobium sp.]|nr:L,D-transpeptidase family protein [Sphingomicrobium sp.]